MPESNRVYVVGDIHGRVDLLRRLHALMREDFASTPPGSRLWVVYLGDYIDRGETSRQVVDLLLDEPLPASETVYLKGNHEAELSHFFGDPGAGHQWFQYGGLATLLSYRVRVPSVVVPSERMRIVRDELIRVMPERHQLFFARLKLFVEIGDYFFVHAGIAPGVPLARQNPADLLWIREPFLVSTLHHEKVVVHGHTVFKEPMVLPNRIGLDTGAYFTGKLTCLVLEGEGRRFITT
ncbi:MAG: serine/threonine protein phosphatase [Magnetococcales bacterium]|nr:serine/threonine protein phosphatase [Magnetococcales bacterium]MBF0155767.1 serine/threonine protein phosphatase [Magnetococcales bacterium]